MAVQVMGVRATLPAQGARRHRVIHGGVNADYSSVLQRRMLHTAVSAMSFRVRYPLLISTLTILLVRETP